MQLSERIKNIKPSATMKTLSLAKSLRASGVDVINMGIGEPDFQTPNSIQEAAIESIQNGKASFYTAASGLEPLKVAIKNHYQAAFNLEYEVENIAVTTGAKMALYATFQALLNPGDEVLLPNPYWVSYSEQIKLAGGVPILVSVPDSGKLDVENFEQHLTAKTKLILLNSPQNPTGEIYHKDDLIKLGNWSVDHDLTIISDEIYGELVYNGNQFTSMGNLGSRIKENTVIINGVSKTYSMTGWRIGIVLGDPQLIKSITAFVSHATGNPATVSQYASVAAFTQGAKAAELMRQEFETRLNLIYPKLIEIPGFDLPVKPHGAFYLFPNIEGALKLTGLSNEAFVSGLLTDAHVAVVDGKAFGVPGHIRLSYALSVDQLEEAMKRIKTFVETNSKRSNIGGKLSNETN